MEHRRAPDSVGASCLCRTWSEPAKRRFCNHLVRVDMVLGTLPKTNARLWRQGQKAETVVVQHIVAKGTIDERILSALSTKDRTQSALIAAVKAELKI